MTEQECYCGRFGHTGPSSAHYGKYNNNMGKQNTQLHHESQMQGCKCAQTREGGWNHVLRAREMLRLGMEEKSGVQQLSTRVPDLRLTSLFLFASI